MDVGIHLFRECDLARAIWLGLDVLQVINKGENNFPRWMQKCLAILEQQDKGSKVGVMLPKFRSAC